MTPTHSSKRPPRSAPAVKMFITAASIATVLGGWVAFSSQTPTTTASSPQALEASLGLSPIPTVMSRPVDRHNQNLSQPESQPVASQANQPALRSVSASPPAGITTTRSSR